MRPWRGRSKEPPRCGVCSKQLRIEDIHGVDNQLGPICRECGPHVIVANRAMYPFWI
jgi:hypothetical protein